MHCFKLFDHKKEEPNTNLFLIVNPVFPYILIPFSEGQKHFFNHFSLNFNKQSDRYEIAEEIIYDPSQHVEVSLPQPKRLSRMVT